MRALFLVVLLLAGIFSTNTVLADPFSRFQSQYAGQEQRDIKSLSENDIKELSRGAGWGFAKAAELNGMPGPKHLLEMKQEIGLSPKQEQAIKDLFTSMEKRAVEAGRQFINLEKELNTGFARKTIDEPGLRNLLEKISRKRMELRLIHLSAHLKTPEILSEAQIEKYNELRGYFSADPCLNVPKGHDPEMWRRHNNCE
ncbi:Spy/CpxP family protein refolding chaperone [Thermodesulfobacteriota bacterium]